MYFLCIFLMGRFFVESGAVVRGVFYCALCLRDYFLLAPANGKWRGIVSVVFSVYCRPRTQALGEYNPQTRSIVRYSARMCLLLLFNRAMEFGLMGVLAFSTGLSISDAFLEYGARCFQDRWSYAAAVYHYLLFFHVCQGRLLVVSL